MPVIDAFNQFDTPGAPNLSLRERQDEMPRPLSASGGREAQSAMDTGTAMYCDAAKASRPDPCADCAADPVYRAQISRPPLFRR